MIFCIFIDRTSFLPFLSPLRLLSFLLPLLILILFLLLHNNNGKYYSAIRILTPLGGQGWWITRSRHRDQSGQDGETLTLLKIQKLVGHGGRRLKSQLLRRLRQESHLNQDHAITLQPGPQSETLSQKKKQNTEAGKLRVLSNR